MFKQIPPVTRNLLVINVIIFMLQLVCEQRGVDLAGMFGLHFALAEDFGLWQLFTYMFLHGSWTHLFFNMFSLWMFGCVIERSLGVRRFLAYYIICGLGAGVCQELWQTGQYYLEGLHNYSLVNTGTALVPMSVALNAWTTIGASGACYGVLLAFGMLYPDERIMLLIPPIPMKAKYFVTGYAVVELFSAFASNGNIAHFAHLGGMLFGWLLFRHWQRRSRSRQWPPRPTRWQRLKAWWANRKASKPRMTVSGGERQFKDRAADYDFNARRRERQQRMDEILAKVSRSGYESLTKEEKDELFDISKK